MSSDQMPAPGKIKLIKFPPPGQEKTSNARGMPGGDVEASIWLIHKVLHRIHNPCLELSSPNVQAFSYNYLY